MGEVQQFRSRPDMLADVSPTPKHDDMAAIKMIAESASLPNLKDRAIPNIRAGEPVAQGKDGFAIVDRQSTRSFNEFEGNRLYIESHPGVSPKFTERVNKFVDTIPQHLQKLAAEKGVTVAIYADSSQLPRYMREGHARRHPEGETVGHLPTFYNAASKRIIIIEKPDLTLAESKDQTKFDHAEAARKTKGVQSFGALASFDPKARSYAPIERNGLHEFAHALDVTVFNALTKTEEFENAYMRARASVKPEEAKQLKYFVQGERGITSANEFDAARQELFAELFTIHRLPIDQRTQRDRLLLTRFAPVVDLLHADKRSLLTH